MIAEPHLVDHWRTRMLVAALGGDELAPLYLLRIWAYCQARGNHLFAIPPAGLRAMCQFAGRGVELEAALVETGFIARKGDFIDVKRLPELEAKEEL